MKMLHTINSEKTAKSGIFDEMCIFDERRMALLAAKSSVA